MSSQEQIEQLQKRVEELERRLENCVRFINDQVDYLDRVKADKRSVPVIGMP
jgi:tetrahydromethanopterin S-methyltransferase subunit G